MPILRLAFALLTKRFLEKDIAALRKSAHRAVSFDDIGRFEPEYGGQVGASRDNAITVPRNEVGLLNAARRICVSA